MAHSGSEFAVFGVWIGLEQRELLRGRFMRSLHVYIHIYDTGKRRLRP